MNREITSAERASTRLEQERALYDCMIGTHHPKVGDKVGRRTIIRVDPTFIVFGQDEGDVENCGAYVTDYREWFQYERRVIDGLEP